MLPGVAAPASRIVIVGGGFAGMNAAKLLARTGSKFEIALIDRRNYHLFQPLLYQVAMAGLSPAEIATPIRSLLSTYPNVKVIHGTVARIDLATRRVGGDFGELGYDYLLLATGAQHAYFGNERWERFAPGLKTLEQATEIRRRVLTAFELAEREPDPVRKKQRLTFVMIVAPDLSVPGHLEVFVLGDRAYARDASGRALPGVAPVAMQQGRYAARTILGELAGRPRQPFAYVDKGQMSTIGRSRAIVQVGRMQLAGWFAWLTWLLIHIYYLSGFKNRLFVLVQWAWSYLTFARGARLIVQKHWRSYPDAQGGTVADAEAGERDGPKQPETRAQP